MNTEDFKNKIIQGDCLEIMKGIPNGSIDMILCDPPYGTVKGIGASDKIKHGMKNKTGWDEIIDTQKMFEEYNRILRLNGCLIMFSQEPYTSKIITEAHSNIPFSYRMVWIKDHFANALIAKVAPVSYYEDIVVFFKKYDTLSQHPLRDWFFSEWENSGLNWFQTGELLGNGMASHYFTKGLQFCLPTKESYEKLQMTGYFNKSFEEIKQIDKNFKFSTKRCFNLPQGKKFKPNVFNYKKDYTGLHPTQKPVALIEDIIEIYTNEGDLVLDNCAGSGTTGVACKNTNRNYILIEKEQEYIDIIKKRLQ